MRALSRRLQKKRPPKVANPKKNSPQASHSGTATLTFKPLISFSLCLIQKQRYDFFSFRKKKDFNNKDFFSKMEKKQTPQTKSTASVFTSCGKEGIRTPEALLTLTRFPGGPLQPLEHLSECLFSSNLQRLILLSCLAFQFAKIQLFFNPTKKNYGSPGQTHQIPHSAL